MLKSIVNSLKSINAERKVDGALHTFVSAKNALTEAIQEYNELNEATGEKIDQLQEERNRIFDEYSELMIAEGDKINARNKRIQEAEALRDKIAGFVEV